MQLNAITASLGRFFAELQRRKVLRAAATYVVGAWIVLQVAVALQTAMSLSASFSGAILALLVIGFFVTLVLAWFYEITPEGVKRTAPATGDAPLVKPQTTDLALAGALALVVVVALVQLLTASPTAPSATPATTTAEATPAKPEPPALGDKSIAVLPFANLSPEKENEYFADGLTEEVLNLLAKIGDLKVISRTSSFAFKGKNTPLPEIARQLGVRHVLEGSVRAAGDDLRVTAQLIDVVTDTHLWSETYNRKMENVFVLQEEIARDIAGTLMAEVTFASGRRKAPTKSLEAYRAFLNARALFFKGDLTEGVELYKRAIVLDPNFAEAHAGLATNYALLAPREPGRANEFLALAHHFADRSLELRPNLARAYGVLGTLARHEFKWEAAIENFSKAVALDPADSITLTSLATTYSMIGRFEKGKAFRDEVARIDPVYNFFVAPAQLVEALARRDDRAVTEIATKLTHAQGDLRGIGFGALALMARERGDIAETERTFRASAQAYGRSPALIDALVRALRSRAAVEQAKRAIREEQANDPTFGPEGTFLVIGDYAGFFDALDTRLERSGAPGFWTWMALAWRASSGDDDASQRFKALARKIGLVDYWKKHGWPDRCRPKGEDDFECS